MVTPKPAHGAPTFSFCDGMCAYVLLIAANSIIYEKHYDKKKKKVTFYELGFTNSEIAYDQYN